MLYCHMQIHHRGGGCFPACLEGVTTSSTCPAVLRKHPQAGAVLARVREARSEEEDVELRLVCM